MSAEPAAAGLLLAAGAGTRLGRPKAFVEVDGEPLLRRALGALVGGGCDPVVVVLGAAAEQAPALPGATVVVNRDWASGMGSSLRHGLAALGESRQAAAVHACVVLLVDTPGVGAAAVRRIRAAADPDTVVMATYGATRGHPVALGRAHWAEVARLAQGDAGARPFLAAHPGLVRLVPCEDVASPADIDTPADLAAYRGPEPPR